MSQISDGKIDEEIMDDYGLDENDATELKNDL